MIWKQSKLSSDGLFEAMVQAHAADNTLRQVSEFTTTRLGDTRELDQNWGVAALNSSQRNPDPYVTPGIRRRISGHSTLVHGIKDHDTICTPHDNQGNQGNNLLHLLKQQLNQSPGIKMIAHGTKCNPRPVWITLHFDEGMSAQQLSINPDLEYQNCLTWRAELRPNKNSIMLPSNTTSMRLGNLRKVSFQNIMGVERGKRTTALRRVQTAKVVDEKECFSLLTNAGTLDLQCLGIDNNMVNASAGEVREGFIRLLGMALSSRGLRLNERQLSPSSATGVVNAEMADESSKLTNCIGGSDVFGNNPAVSPAPLPRKELSQTIATNQHHENSSQLTTFSC
jgi:hypothetical protein